MDHDDKEHTALNAFGTLWKEKFAADSLLVFSTGRSHALYEELRVSHADDSKSELLRRARMHAAQLAGGRRRDPAHAPPRTTPVYQPVPTPRPNDDPACQRPFSVADSGVRFWIRG